MRIQFDVVRGRGTPHSLTIDAPDRAAAHQQLAAQGYTVLDGQLPRARHLRVGADGGRIAPLTPPSHPLSLSPLSRGQRFDALVLIEQLRDLLTAGLSVIEALRTLQRSAPAREASVLKALAARLSAGLRLSDAMALDAAFSPLLVALVRASELTSDLPAALSRFVDHEKRAADVRHRIVSVAVYPLLLVGIGGAVLMFLLFYVMPRFARVFEGMTGELPWSARAMVGWAHWLAGHGGWLLALLGAAVMGLIAVLGTRSVRTELLRRLMQGRFLRASLKTHHLARWYRSTGLLVGGGIPLPLAVSMSNGLLPMALWAEGQAVVQALNDGFSPAEAHVRAQMITPVAEQLMRAGERTGDLGGVLTRIADFHDAEIARRLERAMRALEPIVMVLIGLGVGALVVLMYLPIFELASAIQ